MKYQIFYIIIILILLYIFYNLFTKNKNNKNINSKENFDGRISDVTQEQCGDFCTKIYGCGGFSYDDSNQKCYVSINPILGNPPFDSLYVNEFDPSFLICNKPFPIKDEIDEGQDFAYAKNSIYLCSQEMDTLGKFQYVNGESQQVQDNQKITNDPYKLKQLYWPTRRKDLDANYVTNNDIFNNIIFYEKDDENEHLGQYLFQHKCVNDVPLTDCLQKCALEDECDGVEFNPLLLEKVNNVNDEDSKQTLLQRKNVCCLKKNIKNKIKRRKEHEAGSFYTKKLEDQAYLTNIYIKV